VVALTYVDLFFLQDDDDEVGEDEDEDDGFFVPHGYLSEDEGVTEVRTKCLAQERSPKSWHLVADGLG
jgi:hypothetical protein